MDSFEFDPTPTVLEGNWRNYFGGMKITGNKFEFTKDQYTIWDSNDKNYNTHKNVPDHLTGYITIDKNNVTYYTDKGKWIENYKFIDNDYISFITVSGKSHLGFTEGYTMEIFYGNVEFDPTPTELEGSWKRSSSQDRGVTWTFTGNYMIYTRDDGYTFSRPFIIDGNQIKIDFENNSIYDDTIYTYEIHDRRLNLKWVKGGYQGMWTSERPLFKNY